MKLKDYDINELINILGEKKIVLWGTGKLFTSFYQRYGDFIDSERILAIVDNDVKKQGMLIRWKTQNFYITDINSLKNNLSNTIVLILANAAYDIYIQINELEYMSDCEVCISKFIEAKSRLLEESNRIIPNDFRRSNSQMIPKKIHYCWFGGAKKPNSVLECINSWKKFCPDYEIIRWDESNYDYKWNRYMKEAYERKKWAFVSDVARLDIIYKNGGVYLDTDVELIKSLDNLLYQRCYFGIESGGLVNTGLGFGAVSNHYFVKQLLDIYEDMHFVNDNGTMNTTSCPIIQREAFNSIGFTFDGNYFTTDEITILPESILCPQNQIGRAHV